ncbi:hypothetical protein EYR36_010678 [Pleurotus pulmonarius]|nr:hypothetical protein EYR36_010678 [Pleurotus pulmonarius]
MNRGSSSSSSGGDNEWSSATDGRSSEATASESTPSTPSHRKAARPAWFGSLSRAKGRATAPKLERMEVRTVTVPDEVNPTLTVDLADEVNQPRDPSPPSQSDIPASSEPPPAISTIPSIPAPAPVQSSVPFPIPTSISSPLRSTHSSSVTSVDDEVPVNVAQTPPPSSPPSVVPSPPDMREDGTIRPRTLSSLGPASSRFTLSIPLFGWKAPASNELKTPEGIERSTSGSSTNSETPTIRGDPRPVEPQQPITESPTSIGEANPAEPSASPADPIIETTTTTTTTITTTTSTSTTWWDYLTWKASQPDDTPTNPGTSAANASDAQHVTPDEIDSASSSASTPATPAANAHTDSVPPRISVTDPANCDPNSTLISSSPATATSLPSDPAVEQHVEPAAPADKVEQTEDVISMQLTESQGTLAWFSPWAWYGNGSVAPTIAAEAGQTRVEESGGSVKTESEIVREEALSRSDEPAGGEKPEGKSDVVPDPDPSAAGPEMSANPIEDTITSNRVGWASFFAARGLLTKRIEMKEEGEMEEMNIDEEEVEVAKADDGTKKDEAAKPAGQTTSPLDPPPSPQKASASTRPAVAEKSKRGRDKEPRSKPPAPPLTISDSVKRDVANNTSNSSSTTANKTLRRKSASPAPSTTSTSSKAKPTKQKSGTSTPASRTPNLVLPTWEDTFHARPRNQVPQPPPSTLARTMKFVSGVLFAKEATDGEMSGVEREASGVGSAHGPSLKRKGKSKEIEREMIHFGKALPRAWDVMKKHSTAGSGSGLAPEDVLRGCRKVVVIGIHGWFPGAVMRTMLGEPTGTSSKFVNMMLQALDEFQLQNNVTLEKVTKIPLEGEGTIDRRVEKLYTTLMANEEWLSDIHAADAIFVATHSQGSIVSTHLLDRLLKDGHIRTVNSTTTAGVAVDGVSLAEGGLPFRKPQKVCCLALCGIHLGPLRYLSTSSLLQPYIQYFESTAARELFDFQNTESSVSKSYIAALSNVLHHQVKMVYVASLNDQVVPIYSGLFTSASHPLILRALYIDGDAYHSSDFLSNLLVLLLRIMNSGLSDGGLLTHLSEATAGSLNGVGHSTAYEEQAVFSLAVKYLFLTNDGLEEPPELVIEPFNVNNELNDYEIPWALRDLVADERVYHLFESEFGRLRDTFRDWQPRTTILRDIKRKLQPIQRLPSSLSSSTSNSTSVSKL